MNKTIYIASALVVIFLGYYLYTSNSDQMMSKDKDLVMSPAPASTDQQMKQEEKMMEDTRNKTNVSSRSPVDDTSVEDRRFPKEKPMKSNSFGRFSFLYQKFCRNFK